MLDNNVPAEDGGQLLVLPLTVHLNFFWRTRRGGLQDFNVSPRPLWVFWFLGFWVLGFVARA